MHKKPPVVRAFDVAQFEIIAFFASVEFEHNTKVQHLPSITLSRLFRFFFVFSFFVFIRAYKRGG